MNPNFRLNDHTTATLIIHPAEAQAYYILVERKCPITGEWFMEAGDQPPLSVRGEDHEIEGIVQAAVGERYDLEARPLSYTGEQLQKRREIKSKIVDQLGDFEILSASRGDRAVEDLTRHIFRLYEELETQLLTELEELR